LRDSKIGFQKPKSDSSTLNCRGRDAPRMERYVKKDQGDLWDFSGTKKHYKEMGEELKQLETAKKLQRHQAGEIMKRKGGKKVRPLCKPSEIEGWGKRSHSINAEEESTKA